MSEGLFLPEPEGGGFVKPDFGEKMRRWFQAAVCPACFTAAHGEQVPADPATPGALGGGRPRLLLFFLQAKATVPALSAGR